MVTYLLNVIPFYLTFLYIYYVSHRHTTPAYGSTIVLGDESNKNERTFYCRLPDTDQNSASTSRSETSFDLFFR